MADKIVFGKTLGGFIDRRGSVAIPVTQVSGPSGFSAFIYQCWLNVDYDGAHTAYGLDRPDVGSEKFPLQKNLKPLEAPPHGSLRNARFKTTGHWVGLYSATADQARGILRTYYPGFTGLKADAQQAILNQFLDTRKSTPFGSLEDEPGNGKFPVVQLPQLGAPEPGYYVSISNAHADEDNKKLWDQNRYLDAGKIPFSVVPRLPGVRLGDFGLVIRNRTGESTPFMFGDTAGTGGSTKLGECSAQIYLTLGQGKYNDEAYSFIVFPGSGSGSADQAAVGRMDRVVRSQLQKIANADDALAKRLAPRDPEYDNVNKAIWEHGGPDFNVAHHRAHGGPETRDEDFPEGR